MFNNEQVTGKLFITARMLLRLMIALSLTTTII